MKAILPSGQQSAVQYIFYTEDRMRNLDEDFQNLTYTEEKNSDYVFQRRNVSRVILMTNAMAAFIGKYCYCYFCRKKTPTSLARCNCGNQNSVAIHVIFSSIEREKYCEIETSLIRTEWMTRRKENRRIKIENAGKHSKKEVIELLTIQQERCAYCASSLRTENGNLIYHKDHYVPLDLGGANDIQNLLIACPTCNLQKANYDAPSFIRKKCRQLTHEQREQAKAIRADVKAFKKQISHARRSK